MKSDEFFEFLVGAGLAPALELLKLDELDEPDEPDEVETPKLGVST